MSALRREVPRHHGRRRGSARRPALAAGAVVLGLLAGCGAGPTPAAPREMAPARSAPQALPEGARWIAHAREDLLPFWLMDAALGEPVGNFPTWRCNDGSVYDASKPCPELRDAPRWVSDQLQRDFVRMKSRQIYTYAAGYHLTGDPRLLSLARAGVDFLLREAYDPGTGLPVSYFEKGVPVRTSIEERDSQDLAYAQLGLSMYHYITHDPRVLLAIVDLKDKIFAGFYRADWGMLAYRRSSDARHLVAQLDQINTYLLLVTPLLPEAQQRVWRGDLRRVAHVVKDRFYSPERHVFWGKTDASGAGELGAVGTDFGHAAKSLWLLYLCGRLLKDEDLVRFAVAGTKPLLDTAFLSGPGIWASGYTADGSIDRTITSWMAGELDQLAAITGLPGAPHAPLLTRSYDYWFRRLVDHEHGEVWHSIELDGTVTFPKIHLWKNGYHAMEHALIGYITAQAARREDVVLYYALPEGEGVSRLKPYFLSGAPRALESAPMEGAFSGLRRTKVAFSDVL